MGWEQSPHRLQLGSANGPTLYDESLFHALTLHTSSGRVQRKRKLFFAGLWASNLSSSLRVNRINVNNYEKLNREVYENKITPFIHHAGFDRWHQSSRRPIARHHLLQPERAAGLLEPVARQRGVGAMGLVFVGAVADQLGRAGGDDRGLERPDPGQRADVLPRGR